MGFDARTPVPTTAGWLPANQLKPGDEVFAFTGEPTKVVSVQTYTPRECYKIWFQGGLTIIVDTKTGLPVYSEEDVKKLTFWKRKTVRRKSTVIKPLGVIPIMERQFGMCKMPNCHPIKPKERSLPVDPYDFGRWLLDRKYTRKINNTSVTRELIERYPKIPTGIPEEYLFGSFWQRLQLLRGIIDSRPRCFRSDNQRFVVQMGDFQLCRQIQQLVESLGNHSSLNIDNAKGMYRVIFRSFLRLHPEQVVPARPYTVETRKITKIELVPPRECVFVRVEDKNNTFLIGEGFFGVAL